MKFKVGDVIISIKTRSNTFEIIEAGSERYKLKILSHANTKRWEIDQELTFRHSEVEDKVRLITKLDKVLR